MSQPEVWLRGALPDVPPLPQPVAHSLPQSCEEVHAALAQLRATVETPLREPRAVESSSR